MNDLHSQSKAETVSCYSAIFQVACLDTELDFSVVPVVYQCL